MSCDLPGRGDPWVLTCQGETHGTREAPNGVRNSRGHGQSQRRNLTAGLTLTWGASVPWDALGVLCASACTPGKSVPGNASVSGSMSCGASVSESMIYPPIAH